MQLETPWARFHALLSRSSCTRSVISVPIIDCLSLDSARRRSWWPLQVSLHGPAGLHELHGVQGAHGAAGQLHPGCSMIMIMRNSSACDCSYIGRACDRSYIGRAVSKLPLLSPSYLCNAGQSTRPFASASALGNQRALSPVHCLAISALQSSSSCFLPPLHPSSIFPSSLHLSSLCRSLNQARRSSKRSGFSISALTALLNLASVAPSSARWSAPHVICTRRVGTQSRCPPPIYT